MTVSINRPVHYSDFTVRWAQQSWEIEQSYRLRQQVFCDEQGIFEQHDRDPIDTNAQVIVVIANHGGWHESVVGTVRIDKREGDIWWGSRLAVDPAFRKQIGLGAELIKLAVSSAHALGCRYFFAQVQKKNEALFRRLHWDSCHDLTLMGQPHVLMQAQLDKFPACDTPYKGWVVANSAPVYQEELAPLFMSVYSDCLANQ